jgi:hypothetical protein
MPFRYAVNEKGTEPWLRAIGKLIVNFGGIEAQTYLWLVQLHETVPLPTSDNKLLFAPRVARILELAKTHPETTPRFQSVSDAWSVATDLARFRNRIAHNPIMFGWFGKEEGAPDFMTVLDVKLGGSPGHDDPSISLRQINDKINETASAAQKLVALYRELWPEAPQSL